MSDDLPLVKLFSKKKLDEKIIDEKRKTYTCNDITKCLAIAILLTIILFPIVLIILINILYINGCLINLDENNYVTIIVSVLDILTIITTFVILKTKKYKCCFGYSFICNNMFENDDIV